MTPRTTIFPVLVGAVLAAVPGCNCGARSSSQGGLTNADGEGIGSNVNFGNVFVLQTSAPRNITLTNNGSAPLTIQSSALAGANASDFKLTSQFPASLAVGATATAVAVFSPAAAGARSATLEVTTNGDPGVVPIQLTGFGIDLEICSSPASLAFGDVQVNGTPATLTVTFSNCGESPAIFSLATISGAQASDFSATPVPTTTLPSNGQLAVTVSYDPLAVGASTGILGYQACDSSNDCATGSIPLSGTGVDGALAFSPDPVAFGNVPGGQTVTQILTATNTGTEAISLTGLGTYSGSQSVFAIQSVPSLPAALAIGQSLTFTIAYTPSGAAGGDSDELVGIFTVADPAVLPRQALDPLTGNGSAAPCSLTVTPSSLAFGNVPPGTATTYSVTVTNASTNSSCDVSNVALSPSSDVAYSLPATQATSFSLTPGGTAQISVTIDPSSANPPLLKTGALTFDSNGTPATASVPLTAFVNSACASAATQVIYTVDEDGTFCSFDPTTLTFTVIGTLSCPSSGTPFSMAVDQNAVAWVLYTTGDIFQVNTANAACTATSFTPNQDGLLNFGMSFMSNPTTGADTLYVAGGSGAMLAQPTELATIAFPSLALTTVGSVALGWPELTGTGDGQLWGFFPIDLSTTGGSVLAQLDPSSGAELNDFSLPQLNSDSDDNFALKFYGGAFWLFLGNSVYEIQRSNGAFSTPMPNSGHAVVGAGVSTCVPVQ